MCGDKTAINEALQKQQQLQQQKQQLNKQLSSTKGAITTLYEEYAALPKPEPKPTDYNDIILFFKMLWYFLCLLFVCATFLIV